MRLKLTEISNAFDGAFLKPEGAHLAWAVLSAASPVNIPTFPQSHVLLLPMGLPRSPAPNYPHFPITMTTFQTKQVICIRALAVPLAH